jgi:hypothetical protein
MIEQLNTVCRADALGDGRDGREVTPFREIGNTLDDF